MLSKAWNELIVEFGENIKIKDVKNNYNCLYSKHNSAKDESNRLGSKNFAWKYFYVFGKTFPKSFMTVVENVL